MDFEEFLQIYNFSDTTKAVLQEAFQNRTPVNEVIHDKMMSIFRTYLLVGGMPQAVNSFRKNGNLETVASIHIKPEIDSILLRCNVNRVNLGS